MSGVKVMVTVTGDSDGAIAMVLSELTIHEPSIPDYPIDAQTKEYEPEMRRSAPRPTRCRNNSSRVLINRVWGEDCRALSFGI